MPDALPANATFDDGVHNMEVLDAVARSAAAGGTSVDVADAVVPTTQGGVRA